MLDDLLLAITAGMLILGPVTFVFLPLGDHDAARVFQVLLAMTTVGLVTVAFVADPPSVPAFVRRSAPTGALALALALALAVVGVAVVLSSPLVRHAAFEAALWIGLIYVALTVARSAARYGLPPLLLVPLGASLVFSFFVMVRYSSVFVADAGMLREHLLPGYSNYRFYNHVQTITIPLLIATAFAWPGNRRVRTLVPVALALEFCWLFFSGGRATMLALAAGAVVCALLFGRSAARWLGWLGATAAAGALLYVVLFIAAPMAFGISRDFFGVDFAARTEGGVGDPRTLLWRLALEQIREAPWLGIGPMHYAARVNPVAAHPHNFYLQVAAEWGLPFAAMLFAAAGIAFARFVAATRSASAAALREPGISLVAVLVAVAVDAAFSGNLVMPMSQTWVAFAIGLCVASHGLRSTAMDRPANVARGVPLRAGWAIAGGLVVLALAWGTWPEAADVQAHVDRVRREIVTNPQDNPRTWSHGWIR